uniref:SH2 domain-containing protein n=1 Tax=Trichuris muris TaxID=70415 RepID=A0A5S6QS32_TRIMR
MSEGDFLIFLDDRNRCKPTVVVRDCNNEAQFVPIEQRPKGCFCFQDEDKRDAFVTVETLVAFYMRYGVVIKTHTGTEVRLCSPIRSCSYQKEIMAEQAMNFQQLSYYHDDMEMARCGEMLVRSGDYLIWSTDENDREGSLTLSVRWENRIQHCPIRKDANLGRYILPKERPCRPTESVAKVDYFIKSLVRGKIILNGVQLIRSIPDSQRMKCDHVVSHTSNDSYASVTSVTTLKEVDSGTVPVGELVKGMTKASPCECVLLGLMVPRPFHLLPYFFGECHPSKANKHLQEHGDFLLFVDSTTGRPTVGVKISNETSVAWWHVQIQVTAAGYFWLQKSDIRMLFTNVEELINYYHFHKEPLLGEFSQTAESQIIVLLVNPVVRDTEQNEHALEACKLDADLSYNFGKWRMEDLAELLRRDGDYILCQDDDVDGDAMTVCVRWQDVIKHIHLDYYKYNNFYKIPAVHPGAPTEFAKSTDEFLKMLVRNQIPLHGVILKRAVRRSPKGGYEC